MHREIIAKKNYTRSSMLNSNIALCLLLFVATAFLTSARAQISQSGQYFGKVGGADFSVGVSDDGTTVSFDYFSAPLEQGSGVVGANNTATFNTNRNRQVVVRVQGNTVTGTFLNQAFSATKESAAGSSSGISGSYQGVLIETASGKTTNNLSGLRIYPSGKAVLVVSGVNGGLSVGLGDVGGGGNIAFSIFSSLSTNGDVLRLAFAPNGDVAQGAATSALFPGFTYNYLFVKSKAATVVNVSTRANVSPSQLMTAGFVITGGSKTVLIRAVGPTLGAYGVGNANTDPKLTLFSGQTVIATNDNWGDAGNANEIPTASAQVGAFALTAGSRDAVLLVQLQPGAYTAQVSSAGSSAGDALVEAYEVTR